MKRFCSFEKPPKRKGRNDHRNLIIQNAIFPTVFKDMNMIKSSKGHKISSDEVISDCSDVNDVPFSPRLDDYRSGNLSRPPAG